MSHRDATGKLGPPPRSRPGARIVAIVVFLQAGLAAGCLSAPSPSTPPGNNALATNGTGVPSDAICVPGAPAAFPPPPGGRPSGPAIRFLANVSFYDSIGYDRLQGVVRNDGDANAWIPRVTGSFFDKNGNYLGNDTAITLRSIVPPGGTSPFDVGFYDPNHAIARYDLSVVTNATAARPIGEAYLRACDVRTTNVSDSEGFFHASGLVASNASFPLVRSIVVEMFYDANGTFLGAQEAIPSPDRIPPQGAEPFVTVFDPRGAHVSQMVLILDADAG